MPSGPGTQPSASRSAAYKAAAEQTDAAGQGRTPEGSLAARTSPGAAVDLRLDELRERLARAS